MCSNDNLKSQREKTVVPEYNLLIVMKRTKATVKVAFDEAKVKTLTVANFGHDIDHDYNDYVGQQNFASS